jgi:hypothetical protein
VNNNFKKKEKNRRVVTINITCPEILYVNGEQEWTRRGYKGPADVFQTALRKMTGLEITL